jgi:hypothetical protein
MNIDVELADPVRVDGDAGTVPVLTKRSDPR